MAGLLIEELKRANVQYVVAPYEADSQMVYLERKGIIQGIFSEDSDLLVFGAKRLLTKLDQYGECIMIRRDDFTACREVSLVGWSDREFRQMAIMSGCDYLASIGKMGLKSAYRLIRKHKTIDRVIRAVQFDGKFKVPAGYLEAFTQAELTFLHQWVYCPLDQCLVNFSPLENGMKVGDIPFIGAFVEASIAAGVARGELHPHTKQPLQLPNVPRRNIGLPYTRQAITQTPELKKNKSIDSFFGPKRTPLAELDPNMFAASPSQEQLIRRASGSSWLATPTVNAARPIVARPTVVPASAPVVSRRVMSDSAVRNGNSDRASKRKRLCSEGSSPITEKDGARVESGRSKFFAAASTPSKRSKPVGKKAADFILWSDDSIEEAMLEISMPSETVKQRKSSNKVQVFNDSAPATHLPRVESKPTAEDTSQQTNATSVFSQGQDLAETTPSSDQGVEDESWHLPLPFDASLRAEIKDIHAKFSYVPGRPAFPGKEALKCTNYSTQDRVATIQASKAAPLQAPLVEASAAQSAVVKSKRQVASQAEPEIENSSWQGDGSQIVVPASDPIVPPSPEHRLPEISPRIGGSEDLLVSESEVDEGSEHATPKGNAILDLGRFAFMAESR